MKVKKKACILLGGKGGMFFEKYTRRIKDWLSLGGKMIALFKDMPGRKSCW